MMMGIQLFASNEETALPRYKRGETVTLKIKDGRTIRGELLLVTAESLTIKTKTDGHVLTILAEHIDVVKYRGLQNNVLMGVGLGFALGFLTTHKCREWGDLPKVVIGTGIALAGGLLNLVLPRSELRAGSLLKLSPMVRKEKLPLNRKKTRFQVIYLPSGWWTSGKSDFASQEANLLTSGTIFAQKVMIEPSSYTRDVWGNAVRFRLSYDLTPNWAILLEGRNLISGGGYSPLFNSDTRLENRWIITSQSRLWGESLAIGLAYHPKLYNKNSLLFPEISFSMGSAGLKTDYSDNGLTRKADIKNSWLWTLGSALDYRFTTHTLIGVFFEYQSLHFQTGAASIPASVYILDDGQKLSSAELAVPYGKHRLSGLGFGFRLGFRF